MKTITPAMIEKVYVEHTTSVVVRGQFISPYCGGQPATDDGLAAFIKYQMKLTPGTKEFDEAFARISKEEIGEVDITPEAGELKEVTTYGVNIIRRDATGPYLCVHQVKACLKQAASRLGLFVKKKGSKGDMAEVSRVEPHGNSAAGHTQRIYFLDEDGDRLNTDSDRDFEKIHGSVNTPKGRKSIVVDTETLPEGTQFEFVWRLPLGKLTEEDIIATLAFAQECGLGSARSLERGKWRFVDGGIESAKKVVSAEEKPRKKAPKPKAKS